MSLDNRIYVVSRSQGEYSDRSEDVIVAFHSEDSAKEFVALAQRQFDAATALHPRPDYPDFDVENMSNEEYDAAYAVYQGQLAERAAAAREMAFLDPGAIDEDGYDERPYYFYRAIPLFTALAAATGTAKTPKAVECEASQSGAAKTAQRPTSVASSDKERE